jgi:hypothetical protein
MYYRLIYKIVIDNTRFYYTDDHTKSIQTRKKKTLQEMIQQAEDLLFQIARGQD